ncbi:MAG TPA: universal stress protein [Verrucomicrobiae bacterium]|nr:universal stress protein [Verrucomicrobiae bacterium]
MFSRIVVAVDGSAAAQRAVAAAAALASPDGSEVEVVHVHPWALGAAPSPAGLGPMPPPDVTPVEDGGDQSERAIVDHAVEDLLREGIRATGRIIGTIEPVAQAVIELARDRDAEVIVLGTRGRSQLSGLLLGSTAYQTIHLASCPVLVVP